MNIKKLIYNSVSFRLSKKIEKSDLLLKVYKLFCFTVLKPKDIRQIPIIINNRNHYTYLKDLVEWLKMNGFTNYYVLDNDSSYPPLLEYYQAYLRDRVIYLRKNSGHLAIWAERIIERFPNTFYVYTDSDVLPVLENNPRLLDELFDGLRNHEFALKAGCALKIDDLPDTFKLKQAVLKHEQKFWEEPLSDHVYRADVDTTFSLYLPNFWEIGKWGKHIRIAGDCLLRHQPWYENTENQNEEQQYYKMNAKTSTEWTKLSPVPKGENA